MKFKEEMYWIYKIMGLGVLILGVTSVFYGISLNNSTLQYLGLFSLIVTGICAIKEMHYDLIMENL
jgi:protein-S-isoprenylcysteine O-methyltransferase Ste14